MNFNFEEGHEPKPSSEGPRIFMAGPGGIGELLGQLAKQIFDPHETNKRNVATVIGDNPVELAMSSGTFSATVRGPQKVRLPIAFNPRHFAASARGEWINVYGYSVVTVPMFMCDYTFYVVGDGERLILTTQQEDVAHLAYVEQFGVHVFVGPPEFENAVHQELAKAADEIRASKPATTTGRREEGRYRMDMEMFKEFGPDTRNSQPPQPKPAWPYPTKPLADDLPASDWPDHTHPNASPKDSGDGN